MADVAADVRRRMKFTMMKVRLLKSAQSVAVSCIPWKETPASPQPSPRGEGWGEGGPE